jgi:hypothetical protein
MRANPFILLHSIFVGDGMPGRQRPTKLYTRSKHDLKKNGLYRPLGPMLKWRRGLSVPQLLGKRLSPRAASRFRRTGSAIFAKPKSAKPPVSDFDRRELERQIRHAENKLAALESELNYYSSEYSRYPDSYYKKKVLDFQAEISSVNATLEELNRKALVSGSETERSRVVDGTVRYRLRKQHSRSLGHRSGGGGE